MCRAGRDARRAPARSRRYGQLGATRSLNPTSRGSPTPLCGRRRDRARRTPIARAHIQERDKRAIQPALIGHITKASVPNPAESAL